MKKSSMENDCSSWKEQQKVITDLLILLVCTGIGRLSAWKNVRTSKNFLHISINNASLVSTKIIEDQGILDYIKT